MLGSFSNCPFVPHHAPCNTTDDLVWWKDILSYPILSHPIPGLSLLIDLQAYSDASSGVSIATRCNNKDWKKRMRDNKDHRR
jgi:hypothetical protein